jgi:hypothetical protein
MLIYQTNFSQTWNHFLCTYTNNRCCSIKETRHMSLHTNSLTPKYHCHYILHTRRRIESKISPIVLYNIHHRQNPFKSNCSSGLLYRCLLVLSSVIILFNILFSCILTMQIFTIQSYNMWHGFLSILLRDSCSYFWYQLLKMLQFLCSNSSCNGILKMSPHQFHTCLSIGVL